MNKKIGLRFAPYILAVASMLAAPACTGDKEKEPEQPGTGGKEPPKTEKVVTITAASQSQAVTAFVNASAALNNAESSSVILDVSAISGGLQMGGADWAKLETAIKDLVSCAQRTRKPVQVIGTLKLVGKAETSHEFLKRVKRPGYVMSRAENDAGAIDGTNITIDENGEMVIDTLYSNDQLFLQDVLAGRSRAVTSGDAAAPVSANVFHIKSVPEIVDKEGTNFFVYQVFDAGVKINNTVISEQGAYNSVIQKYVDFELKGKMLLDGVNKDKKVKFKGHGSKVRGLTKSDMKFISTPSYKGSDEKLVFEESEMERKIPVNGVDTIRLGGTWGIDARQKLQFTHVANCDLWPIAFGKHADIAGFIPPANQVGVYDPNNDGGSVWRYTVVLPRNETVPEEFIGKKITAANKDALAAAGRELYFEDLVYAANGMNGGFLKLEYVVIKIPQAVSPHRLFEHQRNVYSWPTACGMLFNSETRQTVYFDNVDPDSINGGENDWRTGEPLHTNAAISINGKQR